MKRYFIVFYHNGRRHGEAYIETDDGTYMNRKELVSEVIKKDKCHIVFITSITELSEQDYKDFTA